MNYASGETPSVGDIVDFGTRSLRFVVTMIHEEGDEFMIMNGERKFDPSLAVLVARHGEPVK